MSKNHLSKISIGILAFVVLMSSLIIVAVSNPKLISNIVHAVGYSGGGSWSASGTVDGEAYNASLTPTGSGYEVSGSVGGKSFNYTATGSFPALGNISASSISADVGSNDTVGSFTSRGNRLRIGTDAQLTNFIRLRPDTGSGLAITGDNDDIGVFVDANNAYVGVGTSNPSYQLHVSGNAYTTGSWQGSDIRFKEDVIELSSSLDKLSKLRGVSYNWKRDEYPDKGFPEGKHFGVIAQEVENIFPELVNEVDGEKAVSYTELIPVLIESVKELKYRNEELSKRLDLLER